MAPLFFDHIDVLEGRRTLLAEHFFSLRPYRLSLSKPPQMGEALYKAQVARLEAERAKANADAAKAGLKAKEMDAREAEIKRAVEEAAELASYLM